MKDVSSPIPRHSRTEKTLPVLVEVSSSLSTPRMVFRTFNHRIVLWGAGDKLIYIPSIWFFARADVPSSLSSNSSSVSTGDLGTPVGNWPSGGCDISKFFSPQTLVFDITLCGGQCIVVWFLADSIKFTSQTSREPRPSLNRPVQVRAPSMPNILNTHSEFLGTCYPDYVVGNGSNYADAYFEVASVRVFSKSGTNTTITPSSGVAPLVTPSTWKWTSILGLGTAVGWMAL